MTQLPLFTVQVHSYEFHYSISHKKSGYYFYRWSLGGRLLSSLLGVKTSSAHKLLTHQVLFHKYNCHSFSLNENTVYLQACLPFSLLIKGICSVLILASLFQYFKPVFSLPFGHVQLHMLKVKVVLTGATYICEQII